jgi:hypothetical protein
MTTLFASIVVLGSPAHPHRALADYSFWCNSYTCWSASCEKYPACMAIDSGTHCESWCNEYTCDSAHCKGCTKCHPEPEAAPYPTIPGVAPNRILLGMAPDYAPYTDWTPTVPPQLGGFNKEFMDLMEPTCGLKVEAFLGAWSNCWTTKPAAIYFPEVSEYIGDYIREGIVHGCTAYTHAQGERGYTLEFTHSILGGLKTAGILTRLVNGKPIVSPQLSDFTNVKVGDVSGWAPTPDTFGFNINYCTGEKIIAPTTIHQAAAGDGNIPGIEALKAGEFDALYLYSDQIYNFQRPTSMASEKALAAGLGTDFAYIQFGLDQWSYNGTTLAISKRGSGLKDVLDPCIKKVSMTKAYTELCESYFEPASCIQNEFSTPTDSSYFYDAKMNERTDSYMCADGYCTCNELP